MNLRKGALISFIISTVSAFAEAILVLIESASYATKIDTVLTAIFFLFLIVGLTLILIENNRHPTPLFSFFKKAKYIDIALLIAIGIYAVMLGVGLKTVAYFVFNAVIFLVELHLWKNTSYEEDGE